MTAAQQSPSAFIERLDALRSKIRACGAQIFSQSLKKAVRAAVDDYFQRLRPQLGTHDAIKEALSELDDELKALIALTHKDAAKNSYIDRFVSAKRLLVAIDAELAGISAGVESKNLFDATDELILKTLRSVLPSAAASYEQALRDLGDEQRMSYRGSATDLREALRETLDHLAPDKDVKQMDGYKQEPNISGPTMKQKVRYILRIRERSKAQIEPLEAAADIIDEIIGTFVRSVYTRSNVSTHTASGRDEVLRLRHYVRLGFIEILEIRA